MQRTLSEKSSKLIRNTLKITGKIVFVNMSTVSEADTANEEIQH